MCKNNQRARRARARSTTPPPRTPTPLQAAVRPPAGQCPALPPNPLGRQWLPRTTLQWRTRTDGRAPSDRPCSPPSMEPLGNTSFKKARWWAAWSRPWWARIVPGLTEAAELQGPPADAGVPARPDGRSAPSRQWRSSALGQSPRWSRRRWEAREAAPYETRCLDTCVDIALMFAATPPNLHIVACCMFAPPLDLSPPTR